jgi:hypothetical protein
MFKILLIILFFVVLLLFIYNRPNNKKKKNCECFDTNSTPIILESYDLFQTTTKSWNGLNSEIPYLSKFFTAIWLPPISDASGNPGYLPQRLYNFNSSWGTEEELKMLLQQMEKYKIVAIAVAVFQHRQGTWPMWFKFEDPSFLGTENVTPDDYYKYIDTTMYYPWTGDDDRYVPEYDDGSVLYVDGLPPDYKTNGLKHCYFESTSKPGQFYLYKDCRNKRPMYDTVGKANDSWLQSVNLCNKNVLVDYIGFLKKIKSLGINGVVYDQADAIAHEFLSLFLNTDISKTKPILQSIIDICDKAKNKNVDKDVKYTLEEDLLSTQLESLTSTSFNYKILQNFTGELYANTNEKEKGWRGLVELLDNVNKPLNENDWAGEFDFGLKFVLNSMLNTKDGNIEGKYFIKNNMLVGIDRLRQLAYTFVDSHSTNEQNKVYAEISGDIRGAAIPINIARMIPAYFIILSLPGTPVIYKPYFDVYKDIGILQFIQNRKDYGIFPDSTFQILINKNNDISWSVSTKKGNFLFEINTIEPTENNIFHKLIFGTKLYMKVTQTDGKILTDNLNTKNLLPPNEDTMVKNNIKF